MALSSDCKESPSHSSSGQTVDRNRWQRLLPERPLHVLLVEEDSSTRQVVSALLSKCGYEVSSTSAGSEAWCLLEQKDKIFDLVLADDMVPPQSGTDLLANIISSKVHKDIPVVMMSSHDSLDMVFKCLLKGAKDFLVKPLRRNELRNLWQHVWRRNHVFGRAGSEGNVQGKKRKATRNLSSGDTSSDNFSVSKDKDDHDICRDESYVQVSGIGKSDKKLKLECNEDLGKTHCEVQRFSPSGQTADSGQDSGVSRKPATAFDFIGTMAIEPALAEDLSKSQLERPAQEVCHQCHTSPVLELTLRRSSSNSTSWGGPAGRMGVHRSNHSAFSKYTGKASSMQQQCIARSDSLPIDQGLHAPGGNDSTKSCVDLSEKINEKIATSAPGNSGPQTLHFPKARHINHGRQFGNSPLLLLPSGCDENAGCVAQDIAPIIFKSASLNSSTENKLLQAFKENPAGNHDPVVKEKEAHITGNLTGHWCGSDKEDLGSSNADLGHISSCTNAEFEGPYQNKYTFHEENLHSKRSEEENLSIAKEDTAFQDLPAYTVVSGRGSNDDSDRGSSLLEENLAEMPVNCATTLNENSLGGQHHLVANANGRRDMDCSGDIEGNVSDMRPIGYDCRSSFREAALFKFRQKRKMRCFEKKVRYQSRKKLAEQRPRVKGQFVRRAVFEAAAEIKATT